MFLRIEPPSEPRNVVVLSTSSTSITVRWDPPKFLGGRDDTKYTLWYQEEGNSERVRAGTVTNTVGVVTVLVL